MKHVSFKKYYGSLRDFIKQYSFTEDFILLHFIMGKKLRAEISYKIENEILVCMC